LCAFEGASSWEQVDFLACMDEKDSAALVAAKDCSKGLDYNRISTCFASDHGQALLEDASVSWNKWCPTRATIPHTFVNQDNVEPMYVALKNALCQAGSTAKACEKQALHCTA